MAKVTPERIHQLNVEFAQTKNLMDMLAVDFHILTAAAVPGFVLQPFPAGHGIVKKMEFAGSALYAHGGFELFHQLAKHQSDTLRGLACYMLAGHELPLVEKFQRIKPLANDAHFGVREWAWTALRPMVIENLEKSLELLAAWSLDSEANVRRFASEMTRPRGVWCRHITELRTQPWRALPLLEPLKADDARYVQLSVGNWLNDASKDHPAWVEQLCAQWLKQSPSEFTQKICKRGLRTLKKIDKPKR